MRKLLLYVGVFLVGCAVAGLSSEFFQNHVGWVGSLPKDARVVPRMVTIFPEPNQELLRTEIRLHNGRDYPIMKMRLDAGCGCIASELDSGNLNSGESAVVSVEVRKGQRVTPFTVNLLFQYEYRGEKVSERLAVLVEHANAYP